MEREQELEPAGFYIVYLGFLMQSIYTCFGQVVVQEIELTGYFHF